MHLDVVAAVIERDGRILCAQKPDTGELARKWEFPGGKVEPGETQAQALEREIDEELGVRIRTGPLVITVKHRYAAFAITLHTYAATITAGLPTAREHLALRWLRREELPSLDWAPADRQVVEKLLEHGGNC